MGGGVEAIFPLSRNDYQVLQSIIEPCHELDIFTNIYGGIKHWNLLNPVAMQVKQFMGYSFCVDTSSVIDRDIGPCLVTEETIFMAALDAVCVEHSGWSEINGAICKLLDFLMQLHDLCR